MQKPSKDEIKFHLKELMLVQEEFIKQPYHSEDELINLGWIEALQWVLCGKEDFTDYDQRYYPDDEPRIIIESQKKRTYEFRYNSQPSAEEAKEDYDRTLKIDSIVEELDNYENKKL
ncbi:MAG: hypothetical protein GOVbin4296_33 [Prokaryotic dsDNA virus sp.]|nr:MAG: hypothetical protein GOVbin4296_33 [Prokaryotic dsDNA virus sp.]|tara:strand:+ start:2338 stop:2688 length:351 start_codon:yes stop_codon:yes gene_type:complete